MRAAPQEPGARPSPYCFPGEGFGRTRPERMEEMTVPLDEISDIREMDAVGVPRAEIARRLSLSRNTVAKYADMADMSPAAPEPRSRARRALGPDDAAWIDAVLEADSGAPRKQRHTAKRIYDRLVAERGYKGSYSTARRYVREWRNSHRQGTEEGYLELEWHRGPRRSTTATSRPWWPESASRSSCSSSRCPTPTPATPGPACPSARSACARVSRGSSGRSGARRRRSFSTTPPRRAGCRAGR